ncbi:tRNA-uridine aminocarboxypropyltransferase [Aestuariibacter sp. GS-14]|uniref:tRNA-uridine aminocarboxypropyltransferase n=1 Tax=Aestuariibacter sp. GS-14 TaxID=2590670 RepID=UPI0015E8464A|nr:tRNA-uridine aminocarboxypropyltransferase [Aestuariibacter sp. GS-14]
MRLKCHRCHYPLKTCICKHVTPVFNRTRVIVLQHPAETKHAKNTVRLLQLALQNVDCYTGKTAEDFAPLAKQLTTDSATTVVLYPVQEAIELTSAHYLQNPLKIDTLIIIDGSWKQAYGIYKRNPWLNQFMFCCLPDDIEGQYDIRKTSVSNGLSSLEAVALGLQSLEGADTLPLYRLFDAFKQQWSLHTEG